MNKFGLGNGNGYDFFIVCFNIRISCLEKDSGKQNYFIFISKLKNENGNLRHSLCERHENLLEKDQFLVSVS